MTATWWKFFGRRGPTILAAILFAAGLFATYKLLGEFHPRDIMGQVHAVPRRSIALAATATVLSFAALAGYDWSGLRYVGRKITLATVGLISFIGFAFSNTLGLGALTGAAVRYRLYPRIGLEPAEIAVVSTFCAAGFGLGIVIVGATALVLRPDAFADLVLVSPDIARWASASLLGVLVGFIAVTYRKGVSLRLGQRKIVLPAGRLLLGQALFSVLDISFAGATLFFLLPAGELSYLDFLPIYALAAVVAVVSHIPGGIGIFEGVILAAMPASLAEASVAAALLLYRVIYYLVPFAAAFALLSLSEVVTSLRAWGFVGRARSAATSTLHGAAQIVLPHAAAGVVFVSGLILMLKPALPFSTRAAEDLEKIFPLAFVELSTMLGSIVGMILIILSQALWRRIRQAMWITVVLMLAGAVLSLGQGLDLDRPFILVGAAGLLVFGRPSFRRRARVFSLPVNSGWALAAAAALATLVWLFLFSHKAVPYDHALWFQFAFDQQAPRGMRAAVAGAVSVLVLYAIVALRASRPVQSLPSQETLSRIEQIVRNQDNADANLALTGDKIVMLSESERSFVMYGARGSSLIALGDPVGIPDEAPDLVWAFKETAFEQGLRAAFYQVGAAHLDWYADAGFMLHKLGEEARVPLADFDLTGPKRRRLRQSHHRALRDGLDFAVVEPPIDDDLIAALKPLSDAWLDLKAAREKGFSLGCFDAAYLQKSPIALVHHDGRLVAFANVLVTATRAEASIDLMRHLPDAPPPTMDFLFAELMLHLRAQGFAEFNLGMAPLSGLSAHLHARPWDRIGAFLFRYGGHFYNFAGLRAFKDKFDPVWRARYLATSGGLDPFVVSLDVAALINGSLTGALKK